LELKKLVLVIVNIVNIGFFSGSHFSNNNNNPFSVNDNRVATIVNERVIVVWNTSNGDLICSFDTKAFKDPLCGISLENNQIFCWSKSAIFAYNYCEFNGLETSMKTHFDDVGLESLSFRNENLFGVDFEFDWQDERDISSHNSFDEPEDEVYTDIVGVQKCQNVFVICIQVNNIQADSSAIKLAFVTNKSCKGNLIFIFLVKIVFNLICH
jgi:hypothetical protein